MQRKQRRSRKTLGGQPVVRSEVAVAAHFATGAGAHGGGKRVRNRRERQEWRRNRSDWS